MVKAIDEARHRHDQGFVLVLAGIAGFILTRNALAPLEEMARRAEQITSERLHERLAVGEGGDELDHLARVFNGLLSRLQESFEQLRRFTSDASHELRTPLSLIKGFAQTLLDGAFHLDRCTPGRKRQHGGDRGQHQPGYEVPPAAGSGRRCGHPASGTRLR